MQPYRPLLPSSNNFLVLLNFSSLLFFSRHYVYFFIEHLYIISIIEIYSTIYKLLY